MIKQLFLVSIMLLASFSLAPSHALGDAIIGVPPNLNFSGCAQPPQSERHPSLPPYYYYSCATSNIPGQTSCSLYQSNKNFKFIGSDPASKLTYYCPLVSYDNAKCDASEELVECKYELVGDPAAQDGFDPSAYKLQCGAYNHKEVTSITSFRFLIAEPSYGTQGGVRLPNEKYCKALAQTTPTEPAKSIEQPQPSRPDITKIMIGGAIVLLLGVIGGLIIARIRKGSGGSF